MTTARELKERFLSVMGPGSRLGILGNDILDELTRRAAKDDPKPRLLPAPAMKGIISRVIKRVPVQAIRQGKDPAEVKYAQVVIEVPWHEQGNIPIGERVEIRIAGEEQ